MELIEKIGDELGRLDYSGIINLNVNNEPLLDKRIADVVALARVRPLKPSPDLAERHVTLFHLCGTDPDVFHELAFGRHADGSVGWQHVLESLPGVIDGEPAPAGPLLRSRLGISIELGAPGASDLTLLAIVLAGGLLAGAWPAWRAYRNALHDGLSIRV